MLFNSIEFLLFLPIVFVLYWFVVNKNLKAQNFLILVASYVFYGWWDWRFLSLIAFSTLVDYWVGIRIQQSEKRVIRRTFLWISMTVNLGLLGFFKYYNFFVESWRDAWAGLGYEMDPWTLNVILPVGISFYTFQTMSYSIDIYRRNLEPTKDFIAFAAFVSFFPQLVAGPIERATNLLPQFKKERSFDYQKAVDGLRQVLWGFFKKVVIADSCGRFVDQVFGDYADQSGSVLFLAAFFFALQIYGDFSGYSDIAIGTSRIFGFSLMQNFAFPYFSRDIAEFWRRWHISLSTWFRDYLYIPLGGSRGSLWMKLRNTFIIFIVSGFWHGANWTFVIWGALNAVYFLPLLLTNRNRSNLTVIAEGKLIPGFKDFLSVLSTFFLTTIAWIFFRSNSVSHAVNYIQKMIQAPFGRENVYELYKFLYLIGYPVLSFILVFLLVEWIGRSGHHALEKFLCGSSAWIRRSFYILLVIIILLYSGEKQSFIYFQF
ncbi:MAG: MBOAT family protein [Bacteroidota bacterium]|nr:MBOAT family protein [Bacteroidota bacterium]